MVRLRWIVPLGLLALAACGGRGTCDTETWKLLRPDGAATQVTIHGGAISQVAGSEWTQLNNAGDCSFKLPVSGQVAGDQWIFTASGQGCGSYSTQYSGQGAANGTFGVASSASGTMTAAVTSPIGSDRFSGTWSATRIQQCASAQAATGATATSGHSSGAGPTSSSSGAATSATGTTGTAASTGGTAGSTSTATSTSGGTTGSSGTCGATNFTVTCPGGNKCPAHSTCQTNNTCGCDDSTFATSCAGQVCSGGGCAYPNWWCAPRQAGACGAANFTVACSSSTGTYFCPTLGSCAPNRQCTCPSSHPATSCAGSACTGGCAYPDWWCAP